jgi:hypothetical protein
MLLALRTNSDMLLSTLLLLLALQTNSNMLIFLIAAAGVADQL